MARRKASTYHHRAKLWRAACKDLGYKSQPLLRLRVFQEATKDRRAPDNDVRLDLHFALLEEVICWYALCAVHLTENLAPERIRTRAILSPVLSIANLLISFNELAHQGLDFSMRVLARTIGEHLDLLRMLLFNPETCHDFIIEDTEEANRFWHRRIAKGKSRAKFFDHLLNEQVIETATLSDFRQLKAWEADWEKKLSLFVHPTWASGLTNAFAHQNFDTEESSAPYGFLGRVGLHSKDLLHFVNWKTFHVERLLWREIQKGFFKDEGLILSKDYFPQMNMAISIRAAELLAEQALDDKG